MEDDPASPTTSAASDPMGAASTDSDSGSETPPQDDSGGPGPTTDGSSSSGAGDTTHATDGTTGAPGGPSFGSGSAFSDVMQMFDYVNVNREGYLAHERWRGPPWTGSGHQTFTWPTTFAWDDDLAVQAQAEADAIAAGGEFHGLPATDGLVPPIYVDGVDTAHSMVSGYEHAGTWEVENESSLSYHHGSARQAIYYHDPGGAGPVLTRLGIGAADAGAGDTIWVLVWE